MSGALLLLLLLLLLPPPLAAAAAAACFGIAAFMVALQAAVKPSCGQGAPAQQVNTWLLLCQIDHAKYICNMLLLHPKSVHSNL
jgi:invasion protein IalB